MKEKVLKLNEMCKVTIGARPQLHFIKGCFQMIILRTPPAVPYRSGLHTDPEKCIDEAIEYIRSKQRTVTDNDIKAGNVNAKYSIQPEITY